MLEVDAQRARTKESHGPSPFENGKQLFVRCQRSLFFVGASIVRCVLGGGSIGYDDDVTTWVCTS